MQRRSNTHAPSRHNAEDAHFHTQTNLFPFLPTAPPANDLLLPLAYTHKKKMLRAKNFFRHTKQKKRMRARASFDAHASSIEGRSSSSPTSRQNKPDDVNKHFFFLPSRLLSVELSNLMFALCIAKIFKSDEHILLEIFSLSKSVRCNLSCLFFSLDRKQKVAGYTISLINIISIRLLKSLRPIF